MRWCWFRLYAFYAKFVPTFGYLHFCRKENFDWSRRAALSAIWGMVRVAWSPHVHVSIWYIGDDVFLRHFDWKSKEDPYDKRSRYNRNSHRASTTHDIANPGWSEGLDPLISKLTMVYTEVSRRNPCVTVTCDYCWTCTSFSHENNEERVWVLNN